MLNINARYNIEVVINEGNFLPNRNFHKREEEKTGAEIFGWMKTVD
jgi:hypothetical protein